MRRTEEKEKLKLGINTTGTTKVDTTTDIYEPEDIPLQKVGVILRSHPESRTKSDNVRNANNTVGTVAPSIPVATIHITSGTSQTTVESQSNSTPSTSG